MNDFKEAINLYRFQDLGFIGHLFTWSNNREGNQNIQYRLDRFLANSSWINSWYEAKVTHPVSSYSDHLPVLLTTKLDNEQAESSRREIRFEKIWEKEEECSQIIRRGWNYLRDIRPLEDVADSLLVIT